MGKESNIRPIAESKESSLTWTQLKLGRHRYHELAGEGKVFASLKWENLFGSLAICATSDRKFSFNRPGFLVHRQITVRRLDIDDDVATMRMGILGKATLEFTNGISYSFRRIGLSGADWQFIDSSGRLVCTIHGEGKLGSLRGKVVFEKEAKKLKDVTLLASLGWYMIVLIAEDSSP